MGRVGMVLGLALSIAVSIASAEVVERRVRPEDGTREQVRRVYHLHNPATDMASTITQLLNLEQQAIHAEKPPAEGVRAQGIVIVPEPIGNSLLVSGAPDTVEQVGRLVEELDQPARLIVVEIVLGETPLGEDTPGAENDKNKGIPSGAALRLVNKPPHLKTISRVRLTTMDNQTASLRVGAKVLRNQAAADSSSPWNPVSTDNVGLVLTVTPRTNTDGSVAMQIHIEQSQPEPEADEGKPTPGGRSSVLETTRIDTLTAQTAIRLPRGQTIVLGSLAQPGLADKELVLLVTAHVMEWKDVKKTLQ